MVSSRFVSVEVPSARGPKKRGQSSARAHSARASKMKILISTKFAHQPFDQRPLCVLQLRPRFFERKKSDAINFFEFTYIPRFWGPFNLERIATIDRAFHPVTLKGPCVDDF